jgi:ABC-type Na+ transport system ATPase subunit NatA
VVVIVLLGDPQVLVLDEPGNGLVIMAAYALALTAAGIVQTRRHDVS